MIDVSMMHREAVYAVSPARPTQRRGSGLPMHQAFVLHSQQCSADNLHLVHS